MYVAFVHETVSLVNVFDSNAVNSRLDLNPVQTKDYNNGFLLLLS